MGGACSSNGGDERCAQHFDWGASKEEANLNIYVPSRIILKWIVNRVRTECGQNYLCPGQKPVVGSCYETWHFINGDELLDRLLAFL
jgi:hypothetical protein